MLIQALFLMSWPVSIFKCISYKHAGKKPAPFQGIRAPGSFDVCKVSAAAVYRLGKQRKIPWPTPVAGAQVQGMGEMPTKFSLLVSAAIYHLLLAPFSKSNCKPMRYAGLFFG